jgi:hypothetical protein
MTHDELLADLDGFIYESTKTNRPDLKFLKAIRAVVELHRTELSYEAGNDREFVTCYECNHPTYPCPTIQAIEKELG